MIVTFNRQWQRVATVIEYRDSLIGRNTAADSREFDSGKGLQLVNLRASARPGAEQQLIVLTAAERPNSAIFSGKLTIGRRKRQLFMPNRRSSVAGVANMP